MGVKKSTVCTSAGPPSHRYTPASSAVLKSTRTRGLSGCRYGAQHLSELARGEFARSTGAGDHLRETLGHDSFRVRVMALRARSRVVRALTHACLALRLSDASRSACSAGQRWSVELLVDPDQLFLRCESISIRPRVPLRMMRTRVPRARCEAVLGGAGVDVDRLGGAGSRSASRRFAPCS